MITYLLYMASPVIIYFFLEFIGGQSVNDTPKYRKVYLSLMFIVMALMIGLRHPDNGSSDTRFYYSFWETMSRVPYAKLGYYLNTVDLEIGYQYTTWFLSHIFHNGQWQLLISGFFFSLTICYFVDRNCKNVLLAFTVFNCLGLFNFMVQGLRQAIAMCICLWAVEPCKQRKPIRFFLLVIIAALFHGSAIVFVVTYFLKYLRFDLKSYLITIVATVLLVLFLPKLFDLINLIINDHYAEGTQSSDGGVVAIAIYAVIIIWGLLLRDNEDDFYPMFIYMTYIAMIAMIMRNTVSGIVERISHYFAFGEMVVLSNSIKSIRNSGEYILSCGFAIMMCLVVAVYKSSYSILIPYLFFWQ